ncbi:MAG TPA: nucleotidyl transferase AbiEii/AbiGii toxin family protein [Chthoniobacteraceae bacterium]|nr:nucleotidyl transferase AbiEii/AbiGii toxin family protein [Chthoniobacteraceae bacterium]
MNQFTALSAEERAIYIHEAAERLNVSSVIVEKDFWVCWMLERLFENPELRPHLVFKGGTSLSKVFGAIQRFSEDIDLSISPRLLGRDDAFLEDAATRTQQRKRMAEIEALCAAAVEGRLQPILETATRRVLGEPGDGRSWLCYELDGATRSPVLLFFYPAAIDGRGGYIPQTVKIEFGSLTDQQPTGAHRIRPLLANVIPGKFEDFASEVVALEVERTFWEKATILHAEYHRPAGQPLRDRFARHYADFAALWQHPACTKALERFDLLERVVIHKSRFFASSWAAYDLARPGTFRLCPPDARIPELERDYTKMKGMFLDVPMAFREIIDTLHSAEKVLNAHQES